MSETRNAPATTIAADPTEQINPLSAINAGVQAARGVTGLRTEQFNLQQSQLQPAYQSMRMLMATNPNPSWDDVNNALAQSARIGGNINGLVANAAEIAGKGGKPADFMRATAIGGMSPWEQGQLVGPRQMNVNTGAGTAIGTVGGPWSGAGAGQFTTGTFVQQGFTPAEASEFISVPDVDANGRPTGTTHMVPRGTVFGTGVPGGGGGGGSAAGGGGGGTGGGGGGGGGSGAAPAGPPPGSSAQPGQPLSQKDADLARFSMRESGNQNIFSNVKVPGYTQEQTGSGYYQIIPSTWATGQAWAGIPPAQRTQLAIQASPQQQYQVASALYDRLGGQPWAQSEPGRTGGGIGGGGGPPASGLFLGASSAQPVGGGGGVRILSPTGQPVGPGGGPGGGGPILTPPAPWMTPIWEQSAKDYSTAVGKEGGLGQRIQPWQSAISIIDAHPDLKTGPTSSQWNAWATTLSQWGIKLPSMPGDSVAAYQELSKALHQGLVSSGAFSGTDMARLEAEASSPNPQMQVSAIRELSARQIGYERFQLAQLKQFRSLHPGEDPDQIANQYRSQTSAWASNLDPVAFGADNLKPDDIANYRRGLTAQQDEKFLRSLKEAHRLFPEITPGGR